MYIRPVMVAADGRGEVRNLNPFQCSDFMSSMPANNLGITSVWWWDSYPSMLTAEMGFSNSEWRNWDKKQWKFEVSVSV